MNRPTYEKTMYHVVSSGGAFEDRVARFATHTPTLTTHTAGTGAVGGAQKKGHPNRVAIIGATGIAVLLVAMGGFAYLRMQQVAVPITTGTVAAVTVPHGAVPALDTTVLAVAPAAVTVPHGAVPALDATVSAPVAVTVPHGAVPVE